MVADDNERKCHVTECRIYYTDIPAVIYDQANRLHGNSPCTADGGQLTETRAFLTLEALGFRLSCQQCARDGHQLASGKKAVTAEYSGDRGGNEKIVCPEGATVSHLFNI